VPWKSRAAVAAESDIPEKGIALCVGRSVTIPAMNRLYQTNKGRNLVGLSREGT
jgi:hypothetical protein